MRAIEKLKLHLEAMISDEDKVEKVVNVAAGIIVKEDELGKPIVLLIQRAADDHWPLHFEFPRGKCDNGKNEDVRKCCLREIKEETGLDVEIEMFLGKFIYYADQGKRKSICYNYKCTMKNPNQKVKLSSEHDSYRWIMEAGEAELMVHPDQRRFIDQVLSPDNKIKNTPENDFTQNNTVEEQRSSLQEVKLEKRFLMPDKTGIIGILTEGNQKVESKDIEGDIFLRSGRLLYGAEVSLYHKKVFAYLGEAGFDDLFSSFSGTHGQYDPILNIIPIAYFDKMKPETIDSIYDMLKKGKQILYYPLGVENLKLTIFAFFKWFKTTSDEGNITNIKIASHITKPFVNFKEIEMSAKYDHPKIGRHTYLYVLK